MPELDYITIKGFKSIASIEALGLRSVNVLIGSNGSGKSNFIGVFSFLHAVREGKLQDFVAKAGGADRILHFGSKVTNELLVHVSFQSQVNQYTIVLAPTEDDRLYPKTEAVYYWKKPEYPRPYSQSLVGTSGEAGISGKVVTPIADYVRHHLSSWRLYHFHDTSALSPMKKTADVNDNRFLRTDGSNLAAFLYFLKDQFHECYQLIRMTVQRVAPFFDDFILEPSRLNSDKIRLEWKHRYSDAFFDSSSLSDGTLRFIALATLFLQPGKFLPSVVLVDEPELGLHPYAITMLASLIKQSAERTQVIVSTQSALLLDHFEPEDVLVADLVDGATEIRRLDSKDLEEWTVEYSLGQLWEKNELGGRPSSGKHK